MAPAFIDITSTDIWLETARLVGLVSVAYIAVLWLAMLLWVYRDIAARTDDPLLRAVSVALVGVFFAPGLLAYVALRPGETRADALNRRLEQEAFAAEIGDARQCPQCRRAAADEFVVCPYCRASLRTPCEDCGRLLSGDWNACPFCAAPRRALQPAGIESAPRTVARPGVPQRAPSPTPVRSGMPNAAAIQLRR